MESLQQYCSSDSDDEIEGNGHASVDMNTTSIERKKKLDNDKTRVSCDNKTIAKSVDSEIKDNDYEDSRSDFFGLQDSNEDTPHIELEADACFSLLSGEIVHIPGSDFWRDNKKEIIANTSYITEKNVRYMPLNRFNSLTNTNKRKLNVNKYEDKDYTKDNCGKICYNSNSREMEQSQPTSTRTNICRKMYFVHSLISQRLNARQILNRPSSKRDQEIQVHNGVINRIKWCVPQYSHLLLSVSMDKKVKVLNAWTQQEPCVQTLDWHSKAVKDAEWNTTGRQIVSASYDRTCILSDVETGARLSTFHHAGFVGCVKFHPTNPSLFVSGIQNGVLCWDTRSPEEPVRTFSYRDTFGQVQDIVFSRDGDCFFTCSDFVSRDSSDRNIMAWDFQSGATLSNQIYQERYTCSRLKLHPRDGTVLLQSQGNYIALFSVNRPYKVNKSKRFHGHKIDGYSIGLDVSPDGSLVYSGSSDGQVCCYDYQRGCLIKRLDTRLDVCMDVAAHPVLPSIVACCSWQGTVQVWK